MKTKNIFLVILAFLGTFFSISATYAAAVLPFSSGIKSQSYSLEWCSPHYIRLQHTWSTSCRTGFFQNIGGVAKVVYNGQDFPTGNISANTNLPSSSTSTAQTLGSATALVNLFSVATGGAFAMEGEGVLTIRTYITDYAENTSFYKMTYKIDKTAPELSFASSSITENTDYTHYEGTVNADLTVTKNDSVEASSSSTATNPMAYPDPLISTYSGDGALPRTVHTRTNLPAFYFQNPDTTSFVLNSTHSDTYGSYLTTTAVSPLGAQGYNGPLTSGEKNFALVPGLGTVATVQKSGLASDFTNADLLDNAASNSQKKYRLRLYDNTVDASGAPGNYSETAFYAVRDNMAPNMGGNGLAGTDMNLAVEKILSFPDSDTVYDKTTTGYNPQTNGVSRFLAATSAQLINYKLSDIGVIGNEIITGTNANNNTVNALYNAGLDTANLKVNIEDATNPASFSLFTTFNNRFDNVLSVNKTFDKVDNDLVSNGTYRKYGVQFQGTPTITGVCDLVGNCLQPKLEFRVVANTLNNITSKISLAPMANGKMIANGTDKYQLSYSLRDEHNNKIVPVQSIENSNQIIKSVGTTLHFQNGLNANQQTNTPNGTKLVTIQNLETTDTPLFSETINTNGDISMQEGVTNPNGNYAVSIASKVPTKGFYPYLSSASILRVASLINNATGTVSGAMTYPKTGNRIGYFAPATESAGNTSEFVIPNTGNLGETGGFSDITLNEADYGKITLSGATNVPFEKIGSRVINAEFASPLVYGLIGMRVLIDGQYSQHFKKLYSIDSAISDYNIYEKNIVAYDTDKDEQPGVLNYTIRREGNTQSTPIETGVRYTSSNNLDIFLTGGMSTQKIFDIKGASGSGFSAELQMSSIIGKIYDITKLRTGFVSALTYKIGGDTVVLPSVARNIKNSSSVVLGQYDMARNYFSDTYTMKSVGGGITLMSMMSDVAITGLTNRYNSITTDTGGTKANSNVGRELTRYDVITSIKKNVSLLSAGFGAPDSSQVKRWCVGGTMGQNFLDETSNNLDNSSANCTQVINGETISFIDGNTILDCGTTTCQINKKRSIIIKNGSLHIKSNITTLDTSGTQTNGQFFIGVMNEGGLANVTIEANSPNIGGTNKKGWLFIDPSITNIDAFLFSQGPMVSYSSTGGFFYTKNLTSERTLRNQLHIMGSLLTLNNIAGSRQSPIECPYIIENCTDDTASMFDLVYLRRFMVVPISVFTGLPEDNNTLVPYHPDGGYIAKKSGGMTGTQTSPTLAELRSITDTTYRPYPMLIERDLRWNSNPSVFFKIDN